MPTLKQISCSIELANSPFPEHHRRYRDGSVECYIATPDSDHPFSIHVIATGYIEQGVAVFVFIDGIYQCNRNSPIDFRKDLSTRSSATAEFWLRQKEEKLPDGTFIAREWSFAELVQAQEGTRRDRQYEQNVGKIEVVVLRCRYESAGTNLPGTAVLAVEPSAAKPASFKISSIKAASKISTSTAGMSGLFNMARYMFDGAHDLDLDGAADHDLSHRDYPKDLCAIRDAARIMPYRQRSPSPDNGRCTRRGPYHTYKQYESQSSDDVYRPIHYPESTNRYGYSHDMRVDADQTYIVPAAFERDSRSTEAETESQLAAYREKTTHVVHPDRLAAHINYVHKEKHTLKEAGFDADVLLRLICEDPNIWSINFASMSPGEIKYLRTAIKQWKRKHTDDAGKLVELDSVGDRLLINHSDSHKSSHVEQDAKTNASAVSARWSAKIVGQQPGSTDTHQHGTGDNKRSDGQQEISKSSRYSNTEAHRAAGSAGDNVLVAGSMTNDMKIEHQTNFVSIDGHGSDAIASSSATRSSRTRNSHLSSSMYSETDTFAVTAQPYWLTWNKSGSSRRIADVKPRDPRKARTPYIYSAPPAPAVSSPSKLDTDRGVQAGKGALYEHKARHPEYIDTMESPYAVFTFKYCSREKLEELLGRTIKDNFKDVVAKAEKNRLMSLSKKELAEELMRLKVGSSRETESKAESGSKQSKAASSRTQAKGADMPTWGSAESKPARSEKAAPAAKSSSKKKTFQLGGGSKSGFKTVSADGEAAGTLNW